MSDNLLLLSRLLYFINLYCWNARTFNAITNIILCICMQITIILPIPEIFNISF